MNFPDFIPNTNYPPRQTGSEAHTAVEDLPKVNHELQGIITISLIE
jgi:hypothetical protein